MLQQQHPLANDDSATIPIPRGKLRANLAELGLIGKIRLVTTWSSARVIDELTSVFASSFGLEEDEQLEFKYLSVVPGAKVLSIAKVSSSFSWSGHAVASLAGQGRIYILSQMQLRKTNLPQSIKDEPEAAIAIISDSESEREHEVKTIHTCLFGFTVCAGYQRYKKA